jgi:glutamine synthetase
MVGSADSIGDPNVILNTIVAESFCEAADILEAADNFDLACHDLIKKYLAEHVRIIFSGDGYSEAWVEEAEKRGLPNIRTMVYAAGALTTEKSVALFERFGIYTKVELESREEIVYETYSKSINIEANAMIGMARKLYIPAVVKYEKLLADTINQLKGAGLDATAETEILSDISAELKLVLKAVEVLERVTSNAKSMKYGKDQAASYRDNVVPAMAALRTPVDKLETLVDKRMWPVPTYEDLMFEV